MSETIRLGWGYVEKNGGPVEVCEHIQLPEAYIEDRDSCEYHVPLSIHCSECEQTYEYTVKVN